MHYNINAQNYGDRFQQRRIPPTVFFCVSLWSEESKYVQDVDYINKNEGTFVNLELLVFILDPIPLSTPTLIYYNELC